jgi:D-glycero-D-manno-heptose 1,7-bisphosphate phosphatase
MQAILLDRDGVINRERADYVKSWAEFEFLPGALPALCQLATLSIPILVVSNQSAIGRGLVSWAEVAQIHRRAAVWIAQAGGRIDDFFVCPHRPDEDCACRKPRPGLLQQAAAAYGLDLTDCLFVGDSVTDVQAAQAVGCPTILVQTGRQGAQLRTRFGGAGAPPLVADLAAAVALIVAQPHQLYG